MPNPVEEFYNRLLRQQGGYGNGVYWQTPEANYGGPNQAGGPGLLAQHPAYALTQQKAHPLAQQQAYAFAHAFAQYIPVAEPPLENAGIRAGEIIAWRCWFVDKDRLRSIAFNDVWEPGIPMTGSPGRHADGVHALKTRAKAIEYGRYCRLPTAVGQVELWGSVIEHEHGYRAEFAAIASIDHILNRNLRCFFKRSLRNIRREYGVGSVYHGKADGENDGTPRL